MTQTEWAYLPNAKHIDWVIASVKEHPEKWDAVWVAAYYAARGATFDAARDAAFDAAGDAAWDAAYDAAWSAAYGAARTAAWGAAWKAASDAAYDVANEAAWLAVFYAARDAIAALIAWDDCAYMIESEVDEIKILAKLGDQKALLLLPACIVYNETKELTKASIAV